MRGWRRATLLLSLAAMGCSNETPVGMTPVTDPGGPGMLPEQPADQPFTFPDGVAGDWTGYFQAYTLPSGSDAIALKLGQNAQGANQIQLVLGVGIAPPPATDPALYWPPGNSVTMPPARLLEGTPYLAHLVHWEGKRVTFSITSSAPWQSWCELQPSYPYGNGVYGCVPRSSQCLGGPSGDPQDVVCKATDGSGVTLSYAQQELCPQRCACDAAECVAQRLPDQAFDITFDSDTSASGAAALGLNATLRLMK